jgi:hypothetical protein
LSSRVPSSCEPRTHTIGWGLPHGKKFVPRSQAVGFEYSMLV